MTKFIMLRLVIFVGDAIIFLVVRDLPLDDLSGVDYVSMQTNFLAESKWPMELSHIRQLIQARIVAPIVQC